MSDYLSAKNLSLKNSKEFSSYLSAQADWEKFPLEQVFNFVLQDIKEKVDELESLGSQYSGQLDKSNVSRSRSFSTTDDEDYAEILNKKGVLVDRLNDAVNQSGTVGISKFDLQTYHEFLSLVKTRFKETTDEIKQNSEHLKNKQKECNSLTSQLSNFSTLTELQSGSFQKQECHQASLQFQSAKTDLDIIMNMLFFNDDEKKEFVSIMSQLVEGFVNHMDSREDQYVEVLPEMLRNPGLLCLLKRNVVVYHPHDNQKIRLCMDE